MRPFFRTVAFLGLSAGLVGCATHPPDLDRGSRANLTVITRDELEHTRYSSLFEAVQALRGRWLRTRGPNTIVGRQPEVQVILDDMRMGGVDALRAMNIDNIFSIHYVDPITAAQRWGGRYALGTIVVNTRVDVAP